MAIFRLSVSKIIDRENNSTCSITVEANSLIENVKDCFILAMEHFNSIHVLSEEKNEGE